MTITSPCKTKASDLNSLYNQIFNSRAAVFDKPMRGADNITEAPPVAQLS